MTTKSLHIEVALAAVLTSALAICSGILAPATASSEPLPPEESTSTEHPAAFRLGTARHGRVRVVTIAYWAHNGIQRRAFLLLPASYRPGSGRPLPLVISPHGRGVVAGSQNVRLWGDLPARGRFAVVNPEGYGRRLGRFSWGYPGQIEDLARMPQVLAEAVPGLRIDRRRVYAMGTSMGGQETLLLLARHPKMFAGAAAFDSVTDLALRYRQFPKTVCPERCLQKWGRPVGYDLQRRMRIEVGGTPSENPQAYADRSPLAFAHELASSGVPLQIWWSRTDKVVTDQRTQSGRLVRAIRSLEPRARLTEYVGSWVHSAEMRAGAYHLSAALAKFGLLHERIAPRASISVTTSA